MSQNKYVDLNSQPFPPSSPCPLCSQLSNIHYGSRIWQRSVSCHRHSPPLALNEEDPRETNFLSRSLHSKIIHLQSLTLVWRSAGNTPLLQIRGGGRGWLCYFLMKRKDWSRENFRAFVVQTLVTKRDRAKSCDEARLWLGLSSHPFLLFRCCWVSWHKRGFGFERLLRYLWIISGYIILDFPRSNGTNK